MLPGSNILIVKKTCAAQTRQNGRGISAGSMFLLKQYKPVRRKHDDN